MVKNRLESFAEYAGLATVAVEWSSLLLYYLKAPLYFGSKYPISYFASLPETRWIFSICYTLAALCFWVFTKHHLAHYYRVPLRIFGVSLLLFVVMGIVPYDPHNSLSSMIHTVIAQSSGLLFVIGMYVLARYARDKILLRVTVVVIFLSVSLLVAFIVAGSDSQLVFTFEAGSWFMIQLWVIWLSFYVRGQQRIKASS